MGVRISEFNWRGDELPVEIDLKTSLRSEINTRILAMNTWLESDDCPGAFVLRSDPRFLFSPGSAASTTRVTSTFIVKVRFSLREAAFAFKMRFG